MVAEEQTIESVPFKLTTSDSKSTLTGAKALSDTGLYERALLIRRVEQRLLQLFSEGKLFGTVHTCIGQEWTGVAIAETLRDGDVIFSNHRGHGHYLARTDDVDGLIAEVMGKQAGVCGGRGGSQHICRDGFYSNGVQGGIVPVTAGLALARKMRDTGNVAVVFIGDGTLGEGALYETLNIASKWNLPLCIVVENNSYAQSTSQKETLAGSIRARAEAFDIKTAHGTTWQPDELIEVAADAVAYVRFESRPLLLQIDTYRLMAHSKGDDDRDAAEVKSYWDIDSLSLMANELDTTTNDEIEARITARIKRAVELAEASPYAEAGGGTDELNPQNETVKTNWTPTRIENPDRVVNRIHHALQRNMRRDERIIIIGEDIEAPYGGAFKVTKHLSAEFPGRVRNTPISEAAIVGIGNGLALAGERPVCEIMFGDFLALAFDQLVNHGAKFRYMYNEQVSVPVIVRTPMGGKRGYGATHSQSLEKHFLGMTGTMMLALHHRFDPAEIYDTLFETIDRPTIVIENKTLYGVRTSDASPEGFHWEHSDERFPTSRLRVAGDVKPDVVILCYGGMLPDVEKAVDRLFDEHEIIAEIVCPVQLYPFEPWALIGALKGVGNLVVVEEGQSFAAFGAEVIAQINESAPGVIKRVRRVAPPRHPIPSCGPLEKELLPGENQVVRAVVEIAHRQERGELN